MVSHIPRRVSIDFRLCECETSTGCYLEIKGIMHRYLCRPPPGEDSWVLQLDVVVVVVIVLSGLDDFKSLLVNVTCIHTPAGEKKKRKKKKEKSITAVEKKNPSHDFAHLLLKKLHCLPVKEGIVLKSASVAFSFLDGTPQLALTQHFGWYSTCPDITVVV